MPAPLTAYVVRTVDVSAYSAYCRVSPNEGFAPQKPPSAAIRTRPGSGAVARASAAGQGGGASAASAAIGSRSRFVRFIVGPLGGSVDADGGPGLGDGGFRRTAGPVELVRCLDRRRARLGEAGARGEEAGEGPVEDPLDLRAVRRAHPLDGRAQPVAAALDGQVEGVVRDARVGVHPAV